MRKFFKKVLVALEKIADFAIGSVAAVCGGPAFFVGTFTLIEMIGGLLAVGVYVLAGLAFGLPVLVPMGLIGLVVLQQRGVFRGKGMYNVR